MTHVLAAVVKSTRIVAEEISNSNTYRDWISRHKYENIPNCLRFVCKMFSWFEIKSLKCLKLKDYVIANKVKINNRNVIIRGSISF